MNVKRLQPGDAGLAKQAFTRLKSDADDRVLHCLSETYLSDILQRDDTIVLVALEGRTPVGFALAYSVPRVDRRQEMMLFYEIEVDQGHRGMGTGKALISALKNICRERSVMKMWVHTNRSNTAALNLYKSTGGIESKHRDEVTFTYYFGNPQTRGGL